MEQPRVLAEEKYPELNKLIQTGKDRGFIMYEELFEQLPEEVTGIAEKLDDIYIRLGELEIDVVEADSVEPDAKDAAESVDANSKKEGGPPKVQARSGTEQLEKTNDPVRMYLREMGTVKLLDREGEVEIARRIEAGEARVFIALSKEPKLLELFLRTNERARRERRGVRELLQGHAFDLEDKAEDRVLENLGIFRTINRLDDESKELKRRLRRCKKTGTMREPSSVNIVHIGVQIPCKSAITNPAIIFRIFRCDFQRIE